MKFQLKHGADRMALIIGGVVLKLPTLSSWKGFLCGLMANMQESSYSDSSPKFCPVKLAVPGGFLNVMAYARPLTDEEWVALDKTAFDKFRRSTAGFYLPCEYKRNSLGYIGEKLVIVDYGG